jgi:DNA polymerase III delta subunit
MAHLKALDLEERLDEIAAAPVCVLAGEDASVRSRCLTLLTAAAAPEELPGSTVRWFEEPPELREVLDELRTVPFLGLEGRRAVVVEDGDAFLSAHWSGLAEYVSNPVRSSTLILCVRKLAAGSPPGLPPENDEDPKVTGESSREPGPEDDEERKALKRAWQAFVKALGAAGAVVDCRPPRWADAKRWLRSRAGQMGKKLTPRAVDSVLEAVGPDLTGLESELQKLSAYVGAERTISERDVAEMVAQARSRSAFDMAEAVSRGDLADALRQCRRLLLRGESPVGLVSVLAIQARRLWQMRRLQAAGAAESEIVRTVKAPDWAVRRALRVLPRLSEEALAAQLRILAEADVEYKTTSVRSQEEGVWLENLLARLCAR